MLTKAKFLIDGMHCTACAMNIDFDLEDIEGVVSSRTNYARQETEITFDDKKVKPDKIVQAISKTGYGAKIQSNI